MRYGNRALWTIAVTVVLAAGCAPQQEPPPAEEAGPTPLAEPEPAPEPLVATAALSGAEGTSHGMVTFTQNGDTTTVTADVAGAPPGLHGFHVHETGECTPPDFTSAGGHFNPTGAIHGAPTDAEHHAGDLGNVQVAEDGSGRLDLTTNMLSVASGPNSVVGRAVILHEGADDFVTQPTGDAGARLACGVVTAVTGMETGGMETTAMATEDETPTY